jgi:hypothetical protein
MTDIVEWLRWNAKEQGSHFGEAADEIERLRKRIELLEGYLSGALNVVEGFAHCDTKEARKALKGEE